MIKFLDKFITRTNNLDYIAKGFQNLSKQFPVKKIFNSINKFSSNSEIRFVGGCVRKIIQKENVDDIDLATNLNPKQVCEALKNSNIKFYETGIEHGTITAVIDDYKYEITSLREDIETVLQENMVISMEPMIMIPEGNPGAGGYREHDILVIGKDSAENITKFPFGPEHNIVKN